MRYFMYIAYDGAAYHGWQVQPNAVSVQQKVNEALSTLLRERTEVVGAGRTDTGVNAAVLVAHFDSAPVADCRLLADKMCRLLPPDIAVEKIVPVRPEAHARFDAVGRTYHYTVYTRKNPFRRYFATRLFFTPDYERMNRAAGHLLGVEDFTSFSKVNTDTKTNICHVTRARWVQVEADCWRFEISADRFLRNMVRAIVGTLLDVGRGRLGEADFLKIIDEKNRCAAGESVPGNALSLVRIDYPDDVFLPMEGAL